MATPTPEQIETMRQTVAAFDAERDAAAKAEHEAKLAELHAITGSAEYTKVMNDLKTLQGTLAFGTNIGTQVSNSYSVLSLLKSIN